ncbi:hypothetical protein [Sphingomonas pituitosa]|nr:hypothetical protein [Sphingomonas pituitosa]
MIRIDPRRAGAHVRTAGKAIVTIGVMFTLFLIAIGTVMGERRR